MTFDKLFLSISLSLLYISGLHGASSAAPCQEEHNARRALATAQCTDESKQIREPGITSQARVPDISLMRAVCPGYGELPPPVKAIIGSYHSLHDSKTMALLFPRPCEINFSVFNSKYPHIVTHDPSNGRMTLSDGTTVNLHQHANCCSNFDAELSNPANTHSVTLCWLGTFILKEKTTGNVVRIFNHDKHVRSLAFNQSDTHIAAGDIAGKASIWDIATGNRLGSFSHGSGPINSLTFNSGGTDIATGGADGRAIIWNIAKGTQTKEFNHGAYINLVAFNPAETHLLTSGSDCNVKIWDTSIGEQVAKFNHGILRPLPSSLAFNSTGTTIIVNRNNKHLFVDVSFLPTLSRLSEDQLALLWIVNEAKELAHDDPISIKDIQARYHKFDRTKFNAALTQFHPTIREHLMSYYHIKDLDDFIKASDKGAPTPTMKAPISASSQPKSRLSSSPIRPISAAAATAIFSFPASAGILIRAKKPK